MANIFSRYLTERFIQPRVDASLAVTRTSPAFAYGLQILPDHDLNHTIGQMQDSDYGLLYAIYRVHTDVAACVKRWAGSALANGWHLGLLDKEAKPSASQQKQMDDLTLWLKNPNPSKRFNRMLYELFCHLGVSGDAYFNKVSSGGVIRELWSVHPATIKISCDLHGAIEGYIQWVNGQRVTQFLPEELTHFALPSVNSDIYGQSPLETVLEEVHMDLQAMRSTKAIFQNGFKPSATMLLNDGMGKDLAESAVSQIKQQHTGASHHHGITVVGGVKEIVRMEQTLKDMEFTQLRALTTEKVANAYGVPKLFLNQKDAADYATSDVQERMFYASTIKPLQDLVAEILTEEIIHTFADDLAFYFNEPDFNDANEVRTDALVAQTQHVLTDDEVREHYFNLPKKTPEQRKAEADQQAAQPVAQPTTAAGKPDQTGGTEAQAAPKKSLLKSVEDIADQRAAQYMQLAEPVEPKLRDFFETQRMTYVSRLHSV